MSVCFLLLIISACVNFLVSRSFSPISPSFVCLFVSAYSYILVFPLSHFSSSIPVVNFPFRLVTACQPGIFTPPASPLSLSPLLPSLSLLSVFTFLSLPLSFFSLSLLPSLSLPFYLSFLPLFPSPFSPLPNTPVRRLSGSPQLPVLPHQKARLTEQCS